LARVARWPPQSWNISTRGENCAAGNASPTSRRPEKYRVYRSHKRLYVDFSWDSVAWKNNFAFGVNAPLLWCKDFYISRIVAQCESRSSSFNLFISSWLDRRSSCKWSNTACEFNWAILFIPFRNVRDTSDNASRPKTSSWKNPQPHPKNYKTKSYRTTVLANGNAPNIQITTGIWTL